MGLSSNSSEIVEIMEMKWIELDELKKDMEERPETYAPWFHLALPIALDAR